MNFRNEKSLEWFLMLSSLRGSENTEDLHVHPESKISLSERTPQHELFNFSINHFNLSLVKEARRLAIEAPETFSLTFKPRKSALKKVPSLREFLSWCSHLSDSAIERLASMPYSLFYPYNYFFQMQIFRQERYQSEATDLFSEIFWFETWKFAVISPLKASEIFGISIETAIWLRNLTSRSLIRFANLPNWHFEPRLAHSLMVFALTYNNIETDIYLINAMMQDEFVEDLLGF